MIYYFSFNKDSNWWNKGLIVADDENDAYFKLQEDFKFKDDEYDDLIIQEIDDVEEFLKEISNDCNVINL